MLGCASPGAVGFGAASQAVLAASDACSHVLIPAFAPLLAYPLCIVQDPLITPEGYLYSREALLENLLQQKKAIKKKMAAYEAQQQDEQRKVNRLPSVYLCMIQDSSMHLVCLHLVSL
jgi:hypothetical protein